MIRNEKEKMILNCYWVKKKKKTISQIKLINSSTMETNTTCTRLLSEHTV